MLAVGQRVASTRRSQLAFVLAKHLLNEEARRFCAVFKWVIYFNKVMSVIIVLAVDMWIEHLFGPQHTAIDKNKHEQE